MNIEELTKETTLKLKKAGISNSRLDAEILISYILKIERYKLIVDKDKPVSEENYNEIQKLVERRFNREPVAYIVGEKEFYSIKFKVTPDVLIPRPETELLVDLAIYYAPPNSEILDLCAGSGAIAIALKYNRTDLKITASDISEKALLIAKENEKNNLEENSINFIHSDLFDKIKNNKFDLIVTNPPYVDPQKKEILAKELTFEPQSAIYAENNGKKIIIEIIKNSKEYLKKTGKIIMEISEDMKEFINEIAQEYGFKASIINDYAKMPRVAVFIMK